MQLQREFAALTPPQQHVRVITDVCAWLVINGMRSEKVQFNLLCEQSVNNVWRKAAYRHLMKCRAEVGTQGCDNFAKDCIDVFRERIDFNVENSIPSAEGFADNTYRDIVISSVASG